ncbi:sugar phosphate nucleotidyltransferase [Bacillus spongiae]|uniref:Sugar phosphate nucleotidyltransferase n=1 Tax=Bacillus spongiae TaxID=2683610 RepID=A0ABU8H9F6_9BACI
MIGIILAGGEGKRLQPYTHSLPKPLVPIDGKPVMEYIIEQMKEADIREIYVTTCYLAEKIKDYFEDGSKWGVRITYLKESNPLGSAGHLFLRKDLFSETIVVISGDAFSSISLKKAVLYHQEKKAALTIITKQLPSSNQFGICEVTNEGRVASFVEKPDYVDIRSPHINTGMYIIEPGIFREYPLYGKLDFAKDVFPVLIEGKEKIYAYPTSEYWRDIGTVSQYKLAMKEINRIRSFPFRTLIKKDKYQRHFVSRVVTTCPDNKKHKVFQSIISETPKESLEWDNGIKVHHGKECWTLIKEYTSSSVIVYSQASHQNLAKEFAKYYKSKIERWQKV